MSKKNTADPASEGAPVPSTPPRQGGGWISALAWVLALILVGCAAYLGWQKTSQGRAAALLPATVPVQALPATAKPSESPASLSMPTISQTGATSAISRHTVVHTIIPNRPREEVREYMVSQGDSIFEISSNFKVKPETILWANYDLLNDNPDMISVGMALKIPPVNGVYYKWQDGDTVETVAARFKAQPEDILSWSENNLDLTDPTVAPGAMIMIPNGEREFKQWIVPTIPRGKAGVNKSIYGAGACDTSEGGPVGSGAFIWPAGNHSVSGNDYWGGHLGIDVSAPEGAAIYAADSGVVVYSGWSDGGYGNMIMIDHGNGYQTLYAHLSSIAARCGQSVGQGNTIGYSGSTGNSTGAHLHFEVRFQGGFVNPWYVLPGS